MLTHRKRSEGPQTEVTLPITPMLDMAFQLMFFFLATFRPPTMVEGQVDLSLPLKSETAAHTKSQQDVRAETRKNETPKVDVAVSLFIKGQHGSARDKIQEILVDQDLTPIRGSTDQELQKSLRERLQTIRRVHTDETKPPTVSLRASKHVSIGEVIKVMDVCLELKFAIAFARPVD